MNARCLTAVLLLASTLVPAAAQQPQQLPRPGQGAPPAPPVQQQLGRQPQGQPPMQQQLGRQPQGQPPVQQQLGRQPQGQPPVQQQLSRPAQGQPGPQGAPAAQGQPPQGGQQQAAPAPSPPRPYTPVTVSLAKPNTDPGLAALRKQIAAIAERKDRAALGRLVATQGFFWFKSQGDGVDKRKSGLENLAAAIDLDAKDGSGWETLAAFASDETAEPMPDRQGVVCSPAGPQFNEQALEDLMKKTETDFGEWAYTVTEGASVKAQPQANAAEIEKLGLQFVRIMFDEQQAQNQQGPNFIRVVTPSGKVGYLSEEDLAPPDLDQVCFVKDPAGAWKIIGLVSSGEE